MKFTPKTEEEIKTDMLLPEGNYQFMVLNGEDTVSKKGNDMIKLRLAIYDGPDMKSKVYDYLLESFEFKLRRAADTCGLLDQYNSGELTGDMFAGCSGWLKLGIQPAKDGFDPSNTVKEYIPQDKLEKMGLSAANVPSPEPGDPGASDDDFPF